MKILMCPFCEVESNTERSCVCLFIYLLLVNKLACLLGGRYFWVASHFPLYKQLYFEMVLPL